MIKGKQEQLLDQQPSGGTDTTADQEAVDIGVCMEDVSLPEKIRMLELELGQSREREKILEDLLEKKLNEIYVHYHIARTIGAVDDRQEMLGKIVSLLEKTFPCDRISVHLLDKRGQIELAYYSGTDLVQKSVLTVGEGTPGRVIESGEHVHIHDLSVFYETLRDFIHHPAEEKRDGSYIGIALKVHNVTVGMIGIDTRTRYGLSVDDMDFLAILSHQIAAGVEKARLFTEIERISQLDGLTGLYNHRVFQEKLHQEISRRSRTEHPLSLMMIDIDHFKQFNDSYGHQAGDAALADVAKIITAQTRCTTIDLCCRYGGEEFAVIMPELECAQAANVAERLRQAVENHRYAKAGPDAPGQVTISIGVASVSGSESLGAEELIRRADQALYRSKRNGRNRVSIAKPDESC